MRDAHTAEFAWFKVSSNVKHEWFRKEVIRVYPPDVCTEVYRTGDMRPCLFNATEPHTLDVMGNMGMVWRCHSLNITDESGENVSYEYAAKRLEGFLC